jgi:hypothetical protein
MAYYINKKKDVADEPEIELDDIAAEGIPLTASDEEVFDPLKSGFFWYTPPLATSASHSTGGQEWCISGHDMQILTMTVPSNSTVITEVGSFMYMHPRMTTDVELTLCMKNGGGCTEGWNRICGGESCAKVLLKNSTNQQGYVGLTPNFPAKASPHNEIFKQMKEAYNNKCASCVM